MSAAPTLKPPLTPPPPLPARSAPARALVMPMLLVALLALAVWGAVVLYGRLSAPALPPLPTAVVKRGAVSFDVHAQGNLKGGTSEMLVAPAVSGSTLSIKTLLDPGTIVHPGEVVVAFDTATQEYNLTQAKEALEQAQQQVVQAQATAQATELDNSYQIAKAQFDVQRAALQVRKNPILDAIDAQKNDLTLATARQHLAQLQGDVAAQKASDAANIATQQAAVKKAEADMATAQANIAAMTLRAQRSGYVSVQPNTSNGYLYAGMPLNPFQIGDTTRSGTAVVEIPDTSTWAVDVTVSEADRGHLNPGQPARIEFIALPGRTFAGRLQSIGATNGPTWNRQVTCTLQLIDTAPELRPGLSANVVIVTGTLPNVLWAPSQAVFDQGGRSYVYRQGAGRQFTRLPVTVVRRSESQVVLQGVRAGDVVALTNPDLVAAAAKSSAAPATPAPPAGGGR